MKIYLIFILTIGIILSSCCNTNKAIDLDKCEFKQFKKELKSLILYDAEIQNLYFNERFKIDNVKLEGDSRRTPRLSSSIFLFKNKKHFIGKHVKQVKKMLKFNKLVLDNSYNIIPSIEHQNCWKKKIDCDKTSIYSNPPILKVVFLTENIIKEAVVIIETNRYELEFR